jgi:peroxisomal trans-2-enoyl-CoA reductase
MPYETKPWQSIYRPTLFLGKIALVTGGGTGIGRSIAIEIASLGATTVIASRDEEKCREAAQEMNQILPKGCKGKIVAGPSCSIRNEEEVEQLIAFIIETFGAIHMLVNNAGGQFVCSAEDMSGNGFSAVVDTNLKGTFVCCREAYTQYMRDHGGTIVNITLGNRNGLVGMVHSAAARAGIENMTATLCNEWIESDVRINCVRPGIIFTESGFKNYGAMGDEFIEKVIPAQPAKRLGSPEEVSSAVVWLLSEGASYVTGAILAVDGGSAYHFLPLIDIPDNAHLPVYGTLPTRAML